MYEADTCRKHVRPKIEAAGWDAHPHCYNEQITLTHERIIVAGNKTRRGEQKRADFLLRFTQDFTLAVVEAKKLTIGPQNVLVQAERYARGLKKSSYDFDGLRAPFLRPEGGPSLFDHPLRAGAGNLHGAGDLGGCPLPLRYLPGRAGEPALQDLRSLPDHP